MMRDRKDRAGGDRIRPGGGLSLGVALLGLLLAAFQASAGPQAAGDAGGTCGECHEQAKEFGSNPHVRVKDSAGKALTGDALCASCHGDGAKHVEGGGDVTLIRSGKGLNGAQACLSCHDKRARRSSMRTGVHAPSETVNCQTCHSVHGANQNAAKQPHLLKSEPTMLCAGCHPGPAAAQRNKPFAHRPGRGGADCVACHDPHGGEGRDSLRETRGGELPCLSCHTEKKGPFAYEHVHDVVGDCVTCHEPHGSVNPRMLNRPAVDQLCLQCHSRTGGSFLGSQPPSFHDLNSPRYRNCTTCHTAVHGSNRSPLLLK